MVWMSARTLDAKTGEVPFVPCQLRKAESGSSAGVQGCSTAKFSETAALIF